MDDAVVEVDERVPHVAFRDGLVGGPAGDVLVQVLSVAVAHDALAVLGRVQPPERARHERVAGLDKFRGPQ